MRECSLVGVGKNETYVFDSTELDPATGTQGTQDHDVYTVGEFKDDQMQNIKGRVTVMCSQYVGAGDFQDGAFSKDTNYDSQAGSGGAYRAKMVSFDASRVARTGTTNHGKRLGVTYCIKAA